MPENYTQARVNMVESQIRTNGVITPALLLALENTPREEFVPKNKRPVAYIDEDIALGNDRYLLEPAVQARLIEAARPQANDVVLDIGGCTGYAAALLSPMVTTIIAHDDNREYLDRVAALWARLGLNNIITNEGPLNLGCARYAPFSLIIINGAVAEIPAMLIDQLAEGGRLIMILKEAGQVTGFATMLSKGKNGNVSSVKLFNAASPYLPGFAPSPAFAF
jgi:protein-L-isoaspartate(D-aspartate) O-methyltransferase